MSAFTSIGGMRDAFRNQVPDPPDQERLPAWTRHGIPGMHNRFYDGRIVQESGDCAEVVFTYEAQDMAPKGARLERVVRLAGNADYADVTYRVTPADTVSEQSYTNLNSVALGSMEDENATVLRSERSAEISIKKHAKGVISGTAWVALATRDGKELFGMSWPAGTFENVLYDRRDYSLLLSLQSPSWKRGEKGHIYRVRYIYARDSPEARKSLSGFPE